MIASGVQYLVVAVLAAGGLRVETSTPDALCPDPESVRAAVRARVGRIEGQGPPGGAEGAGEWLASYTIVHRPDGPGGDVVRLELFDPSNRPRLRRDLPRSDESCAAVAQAIAVVLDLYFRRPSSGPVDGPDGALGVGARGGPDAAASRTAAPAGRDGGGGSGLTLGVFGGWAGGPSRPAVGIDVGLRLRAGWALGLEGSWLIGDRRETVGPGEVSLQSYTLRAHAGPWFAPAPSVWLGFGAEALLGLDHGTATASLDDVNPGFRALFGLGGCGTASFALSRWVALTAAVAADYAPAAWARRFEIAGADGRSKEVLPPAALRLLARLGVDVTF